LLSVHRCSCLVAVFCHMMKKHFNFIDFTHKYDVS
jgi:hypothetical protein